MFATWLKPEGPNPLSILAHQLRRRFLSNRSLLRGARPVYQTARPEGSLVLRSVRPAFEPDPKPTSQRKPSDVLRPFLGRPLLRPALLLTDPKTASKPRRARGRSTLPAPHTDWQRFRPKSFNIACRRRSDLWSPAASACRCRPSERPGPPSRSPEDHAHVRQVAKAKNWVRSLWITGISVTTVGTLSRTAKSAGTGCRSFRPPTSGKCLNRLH